LKDLGRKTGQNGPPERGRSTAKQIKSRRAGEVRIEACAPPERERSTEAHRERSPKTRQQLGKSVLKDLGRSAAKTKPGRISKLGTV